MSRGSLVANNLLSIDDLSVDGLIEILDLAESLVEAQGRSVKNMPLLKGKVVASLFFEESTRTRLSFETAAKRLSADVLSLAVASSSVKKGESLRDTIETIESLGIDAVVLRHRSSGAAHQVAGWVREARVINAGDGTHEHPSQALTDLFSVRRVLCERRGRESRGSGLSALEGARILIVGDIVHSRVARSEMLAYTRAGAQVRVIGPGTLIPSNLSTFGATRAENLEEELGKADVVSLLRMQEERGSGSCVPSLHEFAKLYGITEERASLIRDDAVITHPGPMVRGIEVASRVADDPRMLVRQQVSNGVPIRMAILVLALSSAGESLDV